MTLCLAACQAVLVVAAAALLAGVWRSVWEATGQGAVVAVTVFIVAGLAVGHLLGGPERETSVVLGMSCACRHPAIAFAIASANFPDQRFGGAIILYLLLSLLIGVPYVRWNKSRITREPAGTQPSEHSVARSASLSYVTFPDAATQSSLASASTSVRSGTGLNRSTPSIIRSRSCIVVKPNPFPRTEGSMPTPKSLIRIRNRRPS